MGGPPDGRLALIELLERDGRVRRSFEVWHWPITIGRGLDNQLVLDDPHLASTHLRIQSHPEGTLHLCVADGVRNPVRIGPQRVHAGQSVALPREPWAVGQSRLRVRWPGEVLAPERPWVRLRPARGLALTALLLWGMVLAEFALAVDPGAPLTAWLLPVLSVPFVLTAWSGLWGLLSKLFSQRFEFWPHAAIAVRWALGATLLRWLLPMAAFAMSWPSLLAVTVLGSTALFFGMLRSHSVRVLPGRSKGITVVLLSGWLAFVGVQAIAQHQATDRWFGPLYLSQLGPPGWRLAPAQPVDQFIEAAGHLQERLERNAARDRAKAPDEAAR